MSENPIILTEKLRLEIAEIIAKYEEDIRGKQAEIDRLGHGYPNWETTAYILKDKRTVEFYVKELKTVLAIKDSEGKKE